MSKNSSRLYQLSDEEFIALFKCCRNYSEILRKLGLCTSGSASRTLLFRRMNELSLTREDLSKEKISYQKPNKLSDKDIFKLDVSISGHVLKTHYLGLRKKSYQCDICGISMWNDLPIVLHLDHINGIKTDNRIQNLRLLCPNCDSQMPTYRGKNIKIRHSIAINTCSVCNAPISRKSQYCKKCAAKKFGESHRRFEVDRDTLKNLIRNTPFTTIAKQFGVSDQAVHKRCKMLHLPYRTTDIKRISNEDWEKL